MNELIVIAGIVLIAIAIIGGFTGQFNIPQLSKRQFQQSIVEPFRRLPQGAQICDRITVEVR